MPRKKFYKRKRKFGRKGGKTFFKPVNDYKRFGLTKLMPIYQNMNGFPRNRICKLTFSDLQQEGGGAVTDFEYLYAANSIWQCEYNINGNVNGFSNWSTFYNRCVILASEIEVTTTMNGGSHVPLLLFVHLDNSQNYPAGATLQQIMSMQNTKYKVIQCSENSPVMTKVKLTYDARKFNSLAVVADNDDLTQVIGAGPGPSYPPVLNYFRVTLYSQDATTLTAATFTSIKINYWVYFKEPNDFLG